MDIEIKDLQDIRRASLEFLNLTEEGRVFAFNAPMGAGKTTFICSLLKVMGVEDAEGSPTYSLVNVYESNKYGRIYHFDLYRLNKLEEAFDIGIEEMLYSDDVCLIEWPEKITELLPDNTIWSYIRVNEDNSRTLTVEI